MSAVLNEIDDEAADLLAEARRKAWSTLVCRAAIRGYSLWRSDGADGPLRYFVSHRGTITLIDLEALDRLLDRE